MALMGLIGTNEAARRLGLSIGRTTAMIRSGILRAQKIGKTWIVDEAEVSRVAKLDRKPGRPSKRSR